MQLFDNVVLTIESGSLILSFKYSFLQWSDYLHYVGLDSVTDVGGNLTL